MRYREQIFERSRGFCETITRMLWIYLSPHLDDVAFSCGGLLWEQAQQGESVQVWTLFAGDPTTGAASDIIHELHARWGLGRDVMEARRAEDRLACARLGVSPRHFELADCIYRLGMKSDQPLYPTREALFGQVHAEEQELIAALSEVITREIPPEAVIVCPLALGNHVDHQITRQALERAGRARWFYADYPYVRENAAALDSLEKAGWTPLVFPTRAEGLEAWVEAATAYASQISSFWRDAADLGAQLSAYYQQMGGIRLWRNKTEQPF